MALGNNKLFEIRLKGINRGNLARNCSPGVTYVVATSMDKAYNAMRILYGSDPDYTDAKDFELDSIKLVASETNPNRCGTDTYKLVLADDFFNKFTTNTGFDVKALKEFIEQEKEENADDEDTKDADSDEEETV